jgi:hypothetical protein
MNAEPDEREALSRVAQALAPFGAQFVVVGGWAHQLHWLSDLANPVEFEALRTEDLDIAAPQRVQAHGTPLDRALGLVGFRVDPSGDATPPSTRYVYEPQPSFYLQFITPRTGSGLRRDGSKESAVVIAGVVAECLRYVDLLLKRPWSIELTPRGGSQGSSGARLHVVNASSFMAQKLLVFHDREPSHRAKDIVYLYDTLLLFAGSLGILRALWAEIAGEQPKTTSKAVSDCARRLTATTTDDHRDAAQLLATLGRARAPTAEALRSALDLGLSAIFAFDT